MGMSTAFTDVELITLLNEGNQHAFVAIYDRYWAEMYACAFHLFPHREICEDLVHDVFIYLWNKRGALNIVSIRDYLYIAVKNRALNVIRSRKGQLEFGPEELDVANADHADGSVILKEIQTLYDEGLQQLPERCREILTLSRKYHLSNREIADKMNISIKTVENQINIGLKRMRVVMGEVLFLIFIYNFFGW